MHTSNPGPDSETAARLLTQQHRLAAEARLVLADLDLLALLGTLGDVHLVGSAATGCMAWRDIDIDVISGAPDPARIWSSMAPLAAHPRVRKLRWSNERGSLDISRNPELDGYFLGIHYLAGDAALLWKLDCWFVPSDAPRPDIAMAERLARELTDEQRIAILWIKDGWATRPEYRRTVYSVDIYAAVIDDGVRTPDTFSAWLTNRGRDPVSR